MVGLEELDAFDLLIWLGRGVDAAQRLGCNQSTVSRRSNQCLQVFDLRLHRDEEGQACTRRHPLLTLEREVHQLHRLRTGERLRIESSLLAAPLLAPGLPTGWIAGHLNGLGWQRPMQLLEQRICDVWLTAMGQELPKHTLASMLCIPLLRTPLQMAAEAHHPLLRQGTLQTSDLTGFPRLAPRRALYPCTEEQLGPWRHRTAPMSLEEATRYQASKAGGARTSTSALTLHYGTAFSFAHQTLLQVLPLELGVQTQLSLIVRRDVVNNAPIEQLIETLQQRALEAAQAEQGVISLN